MSKRPPRDNGPYKFVRHPLYLGVVALVGSLWLLLDYTLLLKSALSLWVWFNFPLAPFEEKNSEPSSEVTMTDIVRPCPESLLLPESVNAQRAGGQLADRVEEQDSSKPA